MKKLFLFLFIIFVSHTSFSQKRNNIWMLGGQFGINCGIDFSNGSADTFSLNRDMQFYISNSSICDTGGQLLFYTNGNYVANRNHDFMWNTGGFNPGDATDETYPYGLGLEQGTLIIPNPGDRNQYYIFHESGDWVIHNGQPWEFPLNLSYSLVDMTLDGGLGGITNEKNIHVITESLTLGRITACKHANGRDWWVIVHEYWTDFYYKLLVTPGGIQGPYTQQIGFVHDQYDPGGQGAFSPDGTKYVYLSYDITMDVMDFDRCTGNFSNAETISIQDSSYATVGCAFSPNSRYLYVSNNKRVYQFDTWAGNIDSTKSTVATYDGYTIGGAIHTTFFMMQLAPDNKIYMSTWEGSDVLHVINDPDQAGLACNLVQHQLHLPSFNALGLPNAPNYDLGPMLGSVCDSLTTLTPTLFKEEGGVEIFPNPCVNYFSIESTGSNAVKYFYIEDLVGKRVFANTNATKNIDVSMLSQGIYIVHVLMNDGREVKKKLLKE
jgi:hypothetical protein